MTGSIEIFLYLFLFVTLYFEVYLLLAFLEKREECSDSTPLTNFPRVTVIVPCFNEEHTVARTLHSLLTLNYPVQKLQIIVSDDGSTDKTREVLARYAHNPRVTILYNEHSGKHGALNNALLIATGDIIGCLDADSTADPDALLHIAQKFLEEPSLSAVTPSIHVHNPTGILGRLQNAEYALAIFMRRSLSLVQGMFVTPGPFSFFRRGVFDALGPYREAHNTEDLEIALRMQGARLTIGNVPAARVFTNVPLSLRALIRQRVRWTYGFLKNLVDYKHLLLRPRYGTIGMLVLPTVMFSVVSSIILFGAMLSGATEVAAREFIRFDTVGLGTLYRSNEIGWQFFNTGTATVLVSLLLALTIVLMNIGKHIANKKVSALDIGLYILLYGFIAPLWIVRASWQAIWTQKTNWTSERI